MLSKYIGHLTGKAKKKAGEKLTAADHLRSRRQGQLDHYKDKGKFQGKKYEAKYLKHKKFQDELSKTRKGRDKIMESNESAAKFMNKNDRMAWAKGKVGRAEHRATGAKKAYGLARTGQQRARLGTAAGAAVVGTAGGAYAINRLQGASKAKKKKRTSTKYTRYSNTMNNLIQLNARIDDQIELATPASVWQAGVNAKPVIDKVLRGKLSKSGIGKYARSAKASKLADLRKKSDEWRKYSKSGKGTYSSSHDAGRASSIFRKAARKQRG